MDTYCAVIAKNALEVARERKGDPETHQYTQCFLQIAMYSLKHFIDCSCNPGPVRERCWYWIGYKHWYEMDILGLHCTAGLDLFVEQALKRELCQGPVSKLKNGGSGASMLTVEEGVQKGCEDDNGLDTGTLAKKAAADPLSKAELGLRE
jgi:hypothetical protein